MIQDAFQRIRLSPCTSPFSIPFRVLVMSIISKPCSPSFLLSISKQSHDVHTLLITMPWTIVEFHAATNLLLLTFFFGAGAGSVKAEKGSTRLMKPFLYVLIFSSLLINCRRYRTSRHVRDKHINNKQMNTH